MAGVPSSVELFFFSRTGQRGHRRRATLDYGGHVVEVASAHFLPVRHKGATQFLIVFWSGFPFSETQRKFLGSVRNQPKPI